MVVVVVVVMDTDTEKKSKSKGVLAWMAQNIVAANLLMLALLGGGLLMIPNIKQEVFPEFDLDLIIISVIYPGASPEEVEQAVVLTIEEAVQGLEGVEDVHSTAGESSASVTITLLRDADADTVLTDVRSAVDRIRTFPVDVERPSVSLATTRNEVLSLVIYGDLDELTLRDLANQVRDDLILDERITQAEVSGVRPLEVSIEVSQETLSEYNITLDAIAQTVARGSIELPSGEVRTSAGDLLLRITERRELGSEFEEIVVMSRPDGSQVRVGDIGVVDDGFQETDAEVFFDGQRAALVNVYRVGDQTPMEVSEAVHEYVERRSESLPDGVSMAAWADRSEIYKDRINLLLRNGYVGLALVLLTLGLFLEIRLAFWVTLGIPISFLGAVLFMPSTDVSLNMISLFAFILTLGIVVDDAIIVGEAIYHKRQLGMSFVPAAIAGVKEVAGPVIFAILTTMMAFVPLLFVPGIMGKMMFVLPVVVILVFAISLVESLVILPAHLAHSKGSGRSGPLGWLYRGQAAFSRGLERFVEVVYVPVVRRAVSARYLTIAIGIAVLIVTVGFVRSGGIHFTFMPKVESDVIRANLILPFGTAVDETQIRGETLLAAVDNVFEELGSREEHSRGVLSLLGNMAGGFGPRGGGGGSGSHLYQVWVFLVPSDDRPFTASEFTQAWRRHVGEIPGAENLTFRFSIGPSAGSPIDIELSHTEIDVLQTASTELADRMRGYEGVHDIDDGFSPGKVQFDIRLRPEARSLGVTETDLGRQLRSAFYGAEAVRQQRGRDEVRVYVRLPLEQRESVLDFDEFLVRTMEGGEIPLHQAATVDIGRAYTSIQRTNGRRVVDVTADVDTAVTNANDVIENFEATILPPLLADYPGLSYSLEGEQKEQAEAFEALGGNFTFAMFGIFGLLAVAFKSYLQPVIVMLAIPFGMVGAIFGHVIMGYELSLLSMMGIVALSGIVVNDSLILVVACNRFKEAGQNTLDAVVAGGQRRFRPILLTSLTTFFGLYPMIRETSVQARFLIPMAISLGFGVLFATFITLFLVPALYGVVDDVRDAFEAILRFLRGEVVEEKDITPPSGS